jgi:hypothetical protein
MNNGRVTSVISSDNTYGEGDWVICRINESLTNIHLFGFYQIDIY